MTRNATNTVTTVIVGIAIAATGFAFTSQGNTPSGHDSFAANAATASDHDSFPGLTIGHRAAGTTDASTVTSHVSHLDQAADLHLAAAPTSTSTAQDAADSTSVKADRLELELTLAGPAVDCTRVSAMDLTARQAVSCGLDVADWSLVLAANAWNQARDNSEVIVETATHTAEKIQAWTETHVEQAATTVAATVKQTVDTVRDTTDQVTDRVAEGQACTTAVASNPLDASVRDLAACA